MLIVRTQTRTGNADSENTKHELVMLIEHKHELVMLIEHKHELVMLKTQTRKLSFEFYKIRTVS